MNVNELVISMPVSLVVILAFAFLFAIGCAVYLHRKFHLQIAETQAVTAKFATKKNEEMMVDLELATTDQLLHELKNRPMCPFLLVRPQEHGVTVESHNIPPVPTAQMLTFAAFVVQKQLANQGIDFDGPRFREDSE